VITNLQHQIVTAKAREYACGYCRHEQMDEEKDENGERYSKCGHGMGSRFLRPAVYRQANKRP